jgi:GT2 family glycosyltransferase
LFGTVLLIQQQLVAAIGMLGDRYFTYWGDIDYSVRSFHAGFRNVVLFDAANPTRKAAAGHRSAPRPLFLPFHGAQRDAAMPPSLVRNPQMPP